MGGHLLNAEADLLYWRERNREVDFVAQKGAALTAFEVTSGRRKTSLPGLQAFTDGYPQARPLLVGGQGISLHEFLEASPDAWL